MSFDIPLYVRGYSDALEALAKLENDFAQGNLDAVTALDKVREIARSVTIEISGEMVPLELGY